MGPPDWVILALPIIGEEKARAIELSILRYGLQIEGYTKSMSFLTGVSLTLKRLENQGNYR
jgi:hypothetical protein